MYENVIDACICNLYMDFTFSNMAKTLLLLLAIFLQIHFDFLNKNSYHLPTPKRLISFFPFQSICFDDFFLSYFMV